MSNFRNAWESLDSELERVDEYSLGTRESLQDAVQAVTTILGMQTCEVSPLNLIKIYFYTVLSSWRPFYVLYSTELFLLVAFTLGICLGCRQQMLYQAMQGPILACWLENF